MLELATPIGRGDFVVPDIVFMRDVDGRDDALPSECLDCIVC